MHEARTTKSTLLPTNLDRLGGRVLIPTLSFKINQYRPTRRVGPDFAQRIFVPYAFNRLDPDVSKRCFDVQPNGLGFRLM